MARTFDTTPTAKHLVAIASQKWNAAGAISELVDNSFGPARGNAKQVIIVYSKPEKQLVVIDDGVGMDHIGRLFQLGNTIGRVAGDIGKYGSGGTMALLWLPTEVRIWTLRGGKVMRDHISWADHEDEYPQMNDEWETASLRNTPAALFKLGHGTMIQMTLRHGRSINPDTVQRELERIYAPGLRHGKTIHWLTMASKNREYFSILKGEPFDLPNDESKIVRFHVTVQLPDRDLPVDGVVALIDDLPYSQSCVSIGFGSRVIMATRDCYQSQDGDRSYSGSGVAGWLDLGDGWQDFLSTTKDSINDDRVWDSLMGHIFTEIEPLLKKTEEDHLTVILEGIALDLSDALNDLNENDFDFADGKIGAGFAGNLREDGLGPVKPAPGPLAIVPNVVDPTRKDDLPAGESAPTRMLMRLRPCPDEEMDGALCRIQPLSDRETNLEAEINKDHEIVQELLKARPLNKMGLHLMVTRELAMALIDFPGLLKRLLSKRVQSKLEMLRDDCSRERALARVLMDGTRRPRLDSDAA